MPRGSASRSPSLLRGRGDGRDHFSPRCPNHVQRARTRTLTHSKGQRKPVHIHGLTVPVCLGMRHAPYTLYQHGHGTGTYAQGDRYFGNWKKGKVRAPSPGRRSHSSRAYPELNPMRLYV